MAKITNFELYLNYSDKGREDEEGVNFGEFEEDMDLAEVVQDQLDQSRRNRNLIEKFCIEARIKLNKDPKNNKPMVDVNLVIGGKFTEEEDGQDEPEQGIRYFKLQKLQMNCILKYLDYSTSYTKFQTGVEQKFLVEKMSQNDKAKYSKLYEEYKQFEGYLGGRKKEKKAQAIKIKLSNMEMDYSYETISKLRLKVINLKTFETRKVNRKKEIEKEIQDFENSKRQGLLGRVFSSKTEEERQRDQEEINEFTKAKNKDFDKFTKDEEALLEHESLFSLDNLPTNMKEDYFKFKFSISLEKIEIRLFGYQNNPRQRI